MSGNQKSYFQSHDCEGYRAKVTVEWSWPEGKVVPQEWLNKAEEIAEEAFMASGPKSYDISLALRGRRR